MLKYRHNYDLKQVKSAKQYGSFETWAKETYNANIEKLQEHNIRYETFKESIKEYIQNSKNARHKGKTTHQLTAEEAMHRFERSEYYTTERDKYKWNLYNAIKHDKDLYKSVNKTIKQQKGKDAKFTIDDIFYNEQTGRYEYGGKQFYDEALEQYVSEGGYYIQFEYVHKDGQSMWVGILYDAQGKRVGEI